MPATRLRATARKTRKGRARATSRRCRIRPGVAQAEARSLLRPQQRGEPLLVEAHAQRLLLRDGHCAGLRAARLAHMLAAGPGDLGSVGTAGGRKMRGEQRRIAEGAGVGSLAGAGKDDVRALQAASMEPDVVAARHAEGERVVVAGAA